MDKTLNHIIRRDDGYYCVKCHDPVPDVMAHLKSHGLYQNDFNDEVPEPVYTPEKAQSETQWNNLIKQHRDLCKCHNEYGSLNHYDFVVEIHKWWAKRSK